MHQNSTMNFLKGMGTGVIVGAAALTVGKMMLKENKHNVSKGSAKIIKAAEEIVDGVQTMFR